jgi:hypothetical protein
MENREKVFQTTKFQGRKRLATLGELEDGKLSGNWSGRR